MRPLSILLMLTACGVSQSEHDALKRQVAAMEKRVRAMETRGGGNLSRVAKGGKGAKAGKGGKARARTSPAAGLPRGNVAVAGNAASVFVVSDRHRLVAPGEIPAGTFAVTAVFAAGEPPEKIGPITIEAGKTTTVTCAVDSRRCVISDPE